MLLLSGLIALPLFAAEEKTFIDPTRPGISTAVVSSTPEQATEWILTSIVTGEKPFAIIDNQIKQVGEKIHGITIKSITSDEVKLEDGRRLSLFQSITEHKG